MAIGTVSRFRGKRGPYNQTGLLGLGKGWPPRVSEHQRAMESVPLICPHCKAEGQIFQDRQVERRIFCWCCDRDWWLVRPGNGNGHDAP